ncbi:hypothetical protein CR513_18362, partial [Mucuna pruriens]
MCGVLISWDHFQSPKETLTLSLPLTTSRDRFGVPKVLISDQDSHFCNKTMLTLLEKYVIVFGKACHLPVEIEHYAY